MDEEDLASEEVQGLLAATSLEQKDTGQEQQQQLAQPLQQQNQVALSPKRDIVRSTAVVKWSETRMPVEFSQLSRNTNLNDVPDNLPPSNSRQERDLRDLAWQRQHSDSSSFAMAHSFPDYAGEVDVVSSAENIKRLLKIPYDNSPASLIVHRVGKTLLLDNFDIHKHFLRKESENWTWLREFFLNTVMNGDEMKYRQRQFTSQAVQQMGIMFSKFLYKSLVGQSGGGEVEVSQMDRHHISPSTSPSPVVQQHCVADRLPAIDQVKFGEDGEFRRQTLWTFEHLRMLIGTDLPVFSVGDHPCVSVRLRESSQPINVVTGLDYWLDNLMCNVPEVVMCYHDQGFVQKYELIKTEDIPKMPNSGFDPHEVKDIASNILSFLRNSAAKEGHTYWLYKCPHSDVVKLYDLTTLSQDTKGATTTTPTANLHTPSSSSSSPPSPSTHPQSSSSSSSSQGSNPGNPFTIPVAMLLYRVARKMHLAGRRASKVPQVKALLTTCLTLLDHTQYAEVCTSSYYLMSDMYIPDSCLREIWVDPEPEDQDESPDEDEYDEEPGSERSEFSVSVKDLMDAPTGELMAPRRVHLEGISGTPDERCKDGLQCIRKGLSCLERDLQLKTQLSQKLSQKSSSIVEEQATAKASQAIPLKYEPLNPREVMTKSTQLVQRSAVRKEGGVEDSWHQLSKALLLRKASMANYVLAKELLANKQPGHALKHIRYALHCYESMALLKPSKKAENQTLLLLILKLTAELRHLMGTSTTLNMEEQQRGFNDMSEDDTYILSCAMSVIIIPDMVWVHQWMTNKHENLRLVTELLQAVRDLARPMSQTMALKELLREVAKQMGGVRNELGKIAMVKAEYMLKTGASFEQLSNVWTLSMQHFNESTDSFRKVKDSYNEAMVMLNIVRLHRIAFHAHAFDISDGEDSKKEQQAWRAMKQHFSEASDIFREALQKVDSEQVALRNNILWDWSGNYLTYGLHLQQYPPRAMDRSKVLSEVGELYRQAVKQCQKMRVTEKDDLYLPWKDRLASLEYNLAEMHVVSYWMQQTQPRRANKVSQQVEANYKKSTELFMEAEMPYKMLQAQCKRLAFYHRHHSDKGPLDISQGETIMGMFVECGEALEKVMGADLSSLNCLQGDAHEPHSMLEYLLKPVLNACQAMMKSAVSLERSRKLEVQQRLKPVFKQGLEMQTKLNNQGITTQLKLSGMLDYVTCVKQFLSQPPPPVL